MNIKNTIIRLNVIKLMIPLISRHIKKGLQLINVRFILGHYFECH